MLFVGFCGRFLRRTPDLSKHDLNEYAVDLRRSLGANRVRRDPPSLVAREPGRNQHRSAPRVRLHAGDGPRLVTEEVALSSPSRLSFISRVAEFVRSVGDKFK
jgi:hypothetical protein